MEPFYFSLVSWIKVNKAPKKTARCRGRGRESLRKSIGESECGFEARDAGGRFRVREVYVGIV